MPGGITRLGRLCSLVLVGRQSRRRTTPTKNLRGLACDLGRAKANGVNPYRKSRSGAPSRQIDVVLTCLPDNSCNQAGACRNEKHYAGTPPVRSRGEAWRSGNPGLPYTCPSNRCFSSIFCTLKALGRWAIGDGDRRRKALEVTSHKPALRRSRLRWSFSTHLRQEWGPAASLMTEQPFLGTALLPPWGEEFKKGNLKKACLLHPLSAYRSCLGILKCGRTSEPKRKFSKARRNMTFGAWNVRTLMDIKKSKRSERMTAIVGHELARYKIDIAALSETRLAETGDLTEVGAGYTFFWSGKAKDEPREALQSATRLCPSLKCSQRESARG